MSNRRIRKLKFEYRAGVRYGIKPDVVGNELARIHSAHGTLEPQTVVDESTPDDAPLHPVFEWDTDVAANKYRVWQARNLIKSVRVVHEGKTSSEPVYVHVPKSAENDNQPGYQPVDVVVSRPDMYASALAALTSKFMAAKSALDELRAAAAQAPETDKDRMARIEIAVQAMQAASAAVHALH